MCTRLFLNLSVLHLMQRFVDGGVAINCVMDCGAGMGHASPFHD